MAQVVQAGYMIGDRVLRPAMVGVSKGGIKTAPPERLDESVAIRDAAGAVDGRADRGA